MKKLKTKGLIFLVLTIVFLVLSIVFIMLDPYWVLAILTIPLTVIFVIDGFPLWTLKEKDVNIVEKATFISIAVNNKQWVGCYFDIDGKETKVSIFRNVYKPNKLIPGRKYKIILKKKDGNAVYVERVD